MLGNFFPDLAQGVISRTTGPLKFRFFLQPVMSILLAIRSGLKDSREGKPAFLWKFYQDRAVRKELIADCWQSIGKIFTLAFALDCVYQVIVLRWARIFDALVVAFFLAIVPYVLVRGPINRIASARKPARPLSVSQSKRPPGMKKAL